MLANYGLIQISRTNAAARQSSPDAAFDPFFQLRGEVFQKRFGKTNSDVPPHLQQAEAWSILHRDPAAFLGQSELFDICIHRPARFSWGRQLPQCQFLGFVPPTSDRRSKERQLPIEVPANEIFLTTCFQSVRGKFEEKRCYGMLPHGCSCWNGRNLSALRGYKPKPEFEETIWNLVKPSGGVALHFGGSQSRILAFNEPHVRQYFEICGQFCRCDETFLRNSVVCGRISEFAHRLQTMKLEKYRQVSTVIDVLAVVT